MKKLNINHLIESDIIKLIIGYIKKYKYIVIILIILLILIRIFYSIYLFNYKYNYEDEHYMELLVMNKEKVTDKYISYLVKLEENNKFKDSFILNIYNEDINLKYGDIIKINGKMLFPNSLNNLHEFNYKRYLNSRNIVATIITKDLNKIGSTNSILKYINNFKEDFENTLDNNIPCTKSNLFKSMIYGNSKDLCDDIKISFTKLGLSHILAVSGTNIASLILLISYIKFNPYLSFILICIIIFVFCSIAEFKISVIRASVILIIVLFNSLISIKISKYYILLFVVLLCILYNPYIVFNVSFILSFVAYTGLITLFKQINSLFNVYITKIIGFDNINKINRNIKVNIKTIILYKVLKIISNILSIYFSVQIFLLPIQIYFFKSFPLISVISNIVIYFFVLIQHILGFLLIFLYKIPYVSNILFNLNYLTLFVIINVIEKLTDLNIPIIKLPKPDFLSIICYYVFILLTICGYKIKYILRYKLDINIKSLFKIICILCVIYILYFNIYTTYFKSFVYYFNVEQGNMALIKSGRNTILIDMGTMGNLNLGYMLKNFLEVYNLNKIDYLLITHLHSDHINGLLNLDIDLKINTVIYAIPKNEDKVVTSNFDKSINYINLENYLNEKKIKQIMVEKFDRIKINNNLVIDVLNPRDREVIQKDIINSNSFISLISNNKNSYLFLGDATSGSEKIMINDIIKSSNKNYYLEKLKKIKVIQVGHHGSKTSTSRYLLNNIKPEIGLISSKKTVFGHPHKEVINTLNNYGIKIHITEEKGGLFVKY